MLDDVHVKRFLNQSFPDNFQSFPPSQGEESIITNTLKFVASQISGTSQPKMYVLGLALNFTLLAQTLSDIDPQAKVWRQHLTESDLFARYHLITKRGNTTANTLTLEFNGVKKGIRKLEESVVALFLSLNRNGYPSAYVYNTGQWQKYKPLLVDCFSLSENARFILCTRLLEYALSILPINSFFGRVTKRIRLYEEVLSKYQRSAPGENGGLVLQGIAHGFIKADRPHLSIIADKVRTGSARQKRFGDIDCYSGIDIELSVEVKDLEITIDNYTRQLEGFVNQVIANNVLGMVFVQEIDGSVRNTLIAKGLIVFTLEEVYHLVCSWDWPKQNNALQGLLHHISHIEQNTAATQRLLEFIAEHDPTHHSLAYYQGANSISS